MTDRVGDDGVGVLGVGGRGDHGSSTSASRAVGMRGHAWFWVGIAMGGQKPAGLAVRKDICPYERTSRDWGDEQD